MRQLQGKVRCMDTAGLTSEQRDRLKRTIILQRDALWRIHKRMEAVGWFTDDPLYQAVLAAYHALHATVNVITAASKRPR